MKDKQIRLTFQDCLANQQRLRDMLKTLIKDNRPLKDTDIEDFLTTIPKALMSKGTKEPVYLIYQGGWFIFESVQGLSIRLADLKTNRVKLSTTKPENVEVVVDISELWKFMYRKTIYLLPQAAAEAIHISAENIEKPKQGSFTFSKDEELE